MHKYIGRTVTIIYQNRTGAFTKRRVRILAVDNGKIKAYCYTVGAPRLFLVDQIYAIQVVAVS